MLKGEAKTAYMREYMRRRRAGLATAKLPKPKPPWQPPQHMIEKFRHWQRVARSSQPRLRQPGHVIIDGLDLDTDTWLLASTPAFYEAYRQWNASLSHAEPASSDRSSPTTPAP